MPINRTPFNALVDDDGTNTVGSIWNKAAIAGVILDPADAAYAPFASPAFTGVPTAPTAAAGNASTQLATTAFVATAAPAWVVVPYSAANFTANTGTWTVDSGDQQLFAYRLFGKTLSLKFSLINTTVSGSPAELRITLPASATVALGNQYAALNYFDGAAHGLSTLAALVGATVLRLQRDTYGVATWPTSTNAASFVGGMDIVIA